MNRFIVALAVVGLLFSACGKKKDPRPLPGDKQNPPPSSSAAKTVLEGTWETLSIDGITCRMTVVGDQMLYAVIDQNDDSKYWNETYTISVVEKKSASGSMTHEVSYTLDGEDEGTEVIRFDPTPAPGSVVIGADEKNWQRFRKQ